MGVESSGCRVWMDDDEVVAGIDGLPVAIIPGRHPNIQHEAMGEHVGSDLLGCPLHAGPNGQVGEPVGLGGNAIGYGIESTQGCKTSNPNCPPITGNSLR